MIAAYFSLAFAAIPVVFGPGVDVSGYEKMRPPRIEMRVNSASATSVPWIDSNASRFLSGAKKAYYSDPPSGTAALAAAEAYAWGGEAIIAPSAEDKQPLEDMLSFLRSIETERGPQRANIGVVNDGSKEMAEVLNLMSRRNLLYRVVSSPDPKLDLNIRIGSPQFPRESVKNPNDFAARVREKLTDEKRLVRLFGSSTVLVNLTGDERKARLHIVNYGRRPAMNVRVRVLGEYKDVQLHEASDQSQTARDVVSGDGATELSIPKVTTYAIVDLGKR